MTDDYVKKVAEAVLDAVSDYGFRPAIDIDAIIASVPKPEPSVWMTPDGEGWRMRFEPPVTDVPLGWTPLYTELVVSKETVNARLLDAKRIMKQALNTLFTAHTPQQGAEIIRDMQNYISIEAEQAKPVPELTDEQVDKLLSIRVPGGSEIRDWFLPHDLPKGLENVRNIIRAIERELRGEPK